MEIMLWSILIIAIPERFHTVQPLLFSLLETQAAARLPDVELIYLMDNKRRSVGAKRNDLLAMARGEYISFIDDDDEVAINYVQKIHAAIVKTRKRPAIQLNSGSSVVDLDMKDAEIGGFRADVICFPQRATLHPQSVTHECTYSLAYWRDRESDKRRALAKTGKSDVLNWTGPPAHTMCWRREIAQAARFPDKNFGEDVGWVDKVCEKAKTEIQLGGEPLYFYRFDQGRTATR